MSPALAQARVAPDHLQGTASHLVDLVLHNGKKLALEIGGGITPTPSLTRTIEGSSSISLGIYDPDLSFLQTSLLAEQWDAKIDGLWFRYVSTSKSGKNLTLALEDRDVAKLRNFKGPKKVLRAHSTRAEFVKSLVEEAAPSLDFVCPQLHVKQPIENKEKAKAATAEAKANRGKGLGDAKHLTVDGAAASPAQLELGETAGQIAESVNAPFIVRVALFAALMTESSMGTASPGNVLQALGPEGAPVGNAEEEISGFLTNKPEWTGEGAIAYHRKNPSATFFQIAQATQASEFSDGSNYAKFGDEARAWVEAFSGESGEDIGSQTVTEPYRFEVDKKETYWEAIQRLAKQVNWRAFISAGRFFFMPEPELLQGMVRLAIEAPTDDNPLGTQGVENVDFDFHLNKAVTEVKVTALAAQWKPPPGAVVTIAGYGPASLGFGDAPVKKNSKGQKVGLSSNVNTRTGEGRARYLVSSIESPLTESSDARLITITLKKATAPLKEPAAATKTLTAGGSSAGGVEGSGGTGSKNTLELAKAAFTVKGTTTWTSPAGTITIAKWIYPALLWAKENGGNTEITSGYRPGVDSHTASGASEHQGDCYASGGEKGAIDFGDFTDPVGKEHRESFLGSLAKGYPGPMLIKATGFSDFGHCSATGS